MYQFNKMSILAITTVILAACGTGTKIDANGNTSQVQWKAIDQVTLAKQQGTFPDLQDLAKIHSGMTKDQIYALIGAPHYNDGWHPREWNYLFHFRLKDNDSPTVLTCQYKILFDSHHLAQNFFWRSVSPQDMSCPPVQ